MSKPRWGGGYCLETHLWHHLLEGVHDSRALSLLEVGETAGDDDHGCQHHAQIQLEEGGGETQGGAQVKLSLSGVLQGTSPPVTLDKPGASLSEPLICEATSRCFGDYFQGEQ